VTEPEPRRRVVVHFWRWLTLIAASALALRVVIIVLSRHESVKGDGYEWSAQGNLNAAGHWFVSAFNHHSPDALRPPAWAMVLTIWAWLGQHTWFRQQLLACVIGTVTVLLVGACGRRLAGDRAGLLAAGVGALYAGFWVYEKALLSETLLLPEVALMILLVYRFRERPSLWRALVLGALCGVMAMTRSEEILIFVLVVIPVVFGVCRGAWRRAVGWLGVALLALLIVVMPWTIFNLGRFQHPVFLSNGFGAAAATANCNPAYYGPEIGYGNLGCLTEKVNKDQSVADKQYTHAALHYAESHLSRVPLVLFAREGRTFGFWNPIQQTNIDAQWMGTWVGVTRLEMFSYWLLLIPAVAGLVILRRRRVPVYPLLAFFLTVIVAVATSLGDPRYRAAAEVPLVLMAAVGIDGFLHRKRKAMAEQLPALTVEQFERTPSAVATSDL
jgi:4-amino-4-deoxy-L-arabinose transferase-like glycosyltransferase